MDDEALSRWFQERKTLFETAFLAGTQPWQQSGVGLHSSYSAEDWEVLRRPIADCLTTSGTFLDVGCANGYLLECLLRWTHERGLQILPFGLDFSDKLVALAQRRLPQYADHLFVGNTWEWLPPQRFDYVNTAIDYVPDDLREAYVHRLLERYVQAGGCLLIAEYLGRTTGLPKVRIDEELRRLGFSLELVTSSHLEQEPLRQTRVVLIRNTTS